MNPIFNTTSETLNRTATLVFIDAGVDNYHSLVDGVVSTAEVFVLDKTADGVEQISQVLQQRQNIDAIHIISHGSPGTLYLGNSQLSLDTFNGYANQLQHWNVRNLVLYGCNVAAGDAGEEFVAKLHALTGAEIAASNTLTGSADKGGNWELEVSTDKKLPALTLQAEVIASYDYVLANNFGYEAEETEYQAIDLVPGDDGVTSILTNGGDSFEQISLGDNTFNFYGTNYSNLFVSTKGLISFNSGTSQFSNTGLNSDPTLAIITPLWDDWTANQDENDQILYQFQDIDDDSNDDQLIIEWNEIYPWASGQESPITFQAILDLNTGSNAGDITFNYVDLISSASKSNGGSATVGIRDTSGDPLLVSFDDASNPLLGDGKAIKISVGLSLSNKRVNENVADDTVVGTLTTPDPSEAGDTIFIYTLVDGTGDTDNNLFTIINNQLQINTSPDFETKPSYSIRVLSTDGGELTYEKTFVVNVNDTPTDLSLSSNFINENVPDNSVIGTLNTTDANTSDTSFTYELVAGDGDTDNSAFTIVGNELKVNTSPDFDAKSSYSIRVKTTDEGNLSFEKEINLTVEENATPTDLSLSSTNVEENVDAATVIANLSTTDSDDTSFTYTLVDGFSDNSAFTIDGSELKINASPDFETKSSYSIKVKTTDSAQNELEKTFTINVSDVEESIVIDEAEGGTDKLLGAGLGDTLSGNDGRDYINGKAGDDVLNGGEDNDRVYGGAGSDTLDGGTGNDYLNAGTENDSLDGGDGRDRLYGGDGDDTLNGGADNDYLKGENGNDSLDGGDGRDRLYGNDGADTLTGGSGNDMIYGGDGDDMITGVNADNFVVGELDRMYGGAGNDTFVLGNASGAFYDDGDNTKNSRRDYAYILDFETGDTIQLSGSTEDYILDVSRGSTNIYLNDDGVEGLTRNDELIAVVKGVSLENMDSGFSFVGNAG